MIYTDYATGKGKRALDALPRAGERADRIMIRVGGIIVFVFISYTIAHIIWNLL